MPVKPPMSSRPPASPRRPREHHALYGRARWRRFRLLVLQRSPLCVRCHRAGYIVAATDVHHLTPLRDDISRAFDFGNVETLCHECHSRETAVESSKGPQITATGEVSQRGPVSRVIYRAGAQ